MELLRGRDGLTGRDGVQGPPGPQGKDEPPGPSKPISGGAVYTRWGKSTCPQVEDIEMLYSGITGGTYYITRKEVEPLHPQLRTHYINNIISRWSKRSCL